MRSASLRTSMLFVLLLVLPGCWNSKDIQTMDYATAIGVDYQDGKYITYVQFLNFSIVGRNENVQVGKAFPNWIARGEGETLSQSLSSIYATSQMRVFWGHVKAIVCSESLLKHGIEEAYSATNRFGEVRYNIMVFGTKEKLTDIFSQKSVFNLSPLDTIMISPEMTYEQRSFIVPKTSNQVIAEVTEPADYAMLPSLSIDKKVWTMDKDKKPMLTINGAYFFRAMKMSGWMSEKELTGLRWTQSELRRSLISVPSERNPKASLALINPKYKVRSFVEDGRARFEISLRLEGTLDELNEDMSIREIETAAEKIVREEIRDTFDTALAKRIDALKLEETFYRNHPKAWHKIRDSKDIILGPDSIAKITVKVHLRNTGKYKGKVR